MELTIDLDRETDGRWIAEVRELTGVMVYGDTMEEAIALVKALALRVVADRVALGSDVASIHFASAAPAAA